MHIYSNIQSRKSLFFWSHEGTSKLKYFVSWLQVEKTIFVVFFSGEQARTKILKICEAFGANCYPVPEDINKQRQIIREVSYISFIWKKFLYLYLSMFSVDGTCQIV